MTALFDDDEYVAYEPLEMDRAMLWTAQRRGACVSDVALELASRSLAARAAFASAHLGSDLAQSREGRARSQSRFHAPQDERIRNAA